jgi:NAD+--asparagine ADP-ribosyltransferase
MAGPSEREYREKLNKITENLNKRAKNIRKDFEKLEKMKVNAMKKTEEVRISTDQDIDKIEKDVIKSKDLAPESKQRLHSEIQLLKNRTKEKYSQLRTRISETMIPQVAQQVNY